MVRMHRQSNYDQFAGRGEEWPFAVGEVRGIRMWRVCDRTHLHPMHVAAKHWTQGINEATCLSTEMRIHQDEHRAPDENCSCGFYAYFDTDGPGRSLSKAYGDSPGCVAGVIRGYGRTLIGTEGFRCEKAEIETLYAAETPYAERLKEQYPDVEIAGMPEDWKYGRYVVMPMSGGLVYYSDCPEGG